MTMNDDNNGMHRKQLQTRRRVVNDDGGDDGSQQPSRPYSTMATTTNTTAHALATRRTRDVARTNHANARSNDETPANSKRVSRREPDAGIRQLPTPRSTTPRHRTTRYLADVDVYNNDGDEYSQDEESTHPGAVHVSPDGLVRRGEGLLASFGNDTIEIGTVTRPGPTSEEESSGVVVDSENPHLLHAVLIEENNIPRAVPADTNGNHKSDDDDDSTTQQQPKETDVFRWSIHGTILLLFLVVITIAVAVPLALTATRRNVSSSTPGDDKLSMTPGTPTITATPAIVTASPGIQPPTSSPTMAHAAADGTLLVSRQITIFIQLDDKPEETGWTIQCPNSNNEMEVLSRADPGIYSEAANSNITETYTVDILILERADNGGEGANTFAPCVFEIVDSGGNGIGNGGFFEVHFGGPWIQQGSPCSLLLRSSGTFASSALFSFVVAPPDILVQYPRSPDRNAQNLTDASDYRLVYQLNIPNRPRYGTQVLSYDVDYHLCEGDPSDPPVRAPTFTRIAYYLELESEVYGGTQWVWVSMDAFTDDSTKIGVPTFSSQAVFQQYVSNINVISPNLPSNGGNLTGIIEFWPYNYGTDNALNFPGASSTLRDFGDTRRSTGNYGSMQIHIPPLANNNNNMTENDNVLTGSSQFVADGTLTTTVFAFNSWNAGEIFLCDIGIGVNPNQGENPGSTIVDGAHPDWTFAQNCHRYSRKLLKVYVQ